MKQISQKNNQKLEQQCPPIRGRREVSYTVRPLRLAWVQFPLRWQFSRGKALRSVRFEWRPACCPFCPLAAQTCWSQILSFPFLLVLFLHMKEGVLHAQIFQRVSLQNPAVEIQYQCDLLIISVRFIMFCKLIKLVKRGTKHVTVTLSIYFSSLGQVTSEDCNVQLSVWK